jgi:hypothetical protein
MMIVRHVCYPMNIYISLKDYTMSDNIFRKFISLFHLHPTKMKENFAAAATKTATKKTPFLR